MKRSEMLDHIKEDLLEKLKHRWLERGETDKWAEYTANELLDMIEGFDMFYCPVEDLGEFQLRTPKGWEPEDES